MHQLAVVFVMWTKFLCDLEIERVLALLEALTWMAWATQLVLLLLQKVVYVMNLTSQAVGVPF